MTIVLCLNSGDHIYLAADSQISRQDPTTGTIKPAGYRFKLYPLSRYCNAVVGFSGLVRNAKEVIARIVRFAHDEKEAKTEEYLFNSLPTLLATSAGSLRLGTEDDLRLIFVGLTPHSRAYEQEKYPGLGVPPKTFCAEYSFDRESGKVNVTAGKAIHVPSSPKIKMISPDPMLLMDCFAIGIGAQALRSLVGEYYRFKYYPSWFAMELIPRGLASFFSESQIPGIGGAYQVATVSETGVRIQLFDPREYEDGVTLIDWKEGAAILSNSKTGEVVVVQPMWDDDRLPFDYLL